MPQASGSGSTTRANWKHVNSVGDVNGEQAEEQDEDTDVES